MARNGEFINYLLDLLSTTGPASAKPMFGGYGLYMHGVMFALIADEVLYFKTNGDNLSDYLQNDLKPFSYMRQNKRVSLSYYEAPAEVHDDINVMQQWANKAIEAALSAPQK